MKTFNRSCYRRPNYQKIEYSDCARVEIIPQAFKIVLDKHNDRKWNHPIQPILAQRQPTPYTDIYFNYLHILQNLTLKYPAARSYGTRNERSSFVTSELIFCCVLFMEKGCRPYLHQANKSILVLMMQIACVQPYQN